MAYGLLITSSIGLTAITLYFQSRFWEATFLILFTGTVCWLLGNVMLVLWNMYPVAVSWWMAFLLFTIVASRANASRARDKNKFSNFTLYLVLGLFTIGLLMPFHGNGRLWMGAGLVCTALWLIAYDSARGLMKIEAMSRYTGIALLTGFIWLLATGMFMLAGELAGPMYDTALHSFFIGFLFSVIMAHGPMILPSLLGLSTKLFHPILYSWLILMECSLVVRITANFANEFFLRKWAGILNGIAILAFFITMAILLIRLLRAAKTTKVMKIS
jgi:hypothetical protein